MRSWIYIPSASSPPIDHWIGFDFAAYGNPSWVTDVSDSGTNTTDSRSDSDSGSGEVADFLVRHYLKTDVAAYVNFTYNISGSYYISTSGGSSYPVKVYDEVSGQFSNLLSSQYSTGSHSFSKTDTVTCLTGTYGSDFAFIHDLQIQTRFLMNTLINSLSYSMDFTVNSITPA